MAKFCRGMESWVQTRYPNQRLLVLDCCQVNEFWVKGEHDGSLIGSRVIHHEAQSFVAQLVPKADDDKAMQGLPFA